LPENAKLNSEYFRENMIRKLNLIVHPICQKSHTTRIYLHFDHALADNKGTIAQTIAESDFSRLYHLSYSLDLEPCGLFLSGSRHEKLIESISEMVEELKEKTRVVIESTRILD
jgi:hypothetical protein